MPSSFGRVESHCLGCEGAFTGRQGQHIALETLGGIAKRTPNDPRVHYLLGYLYEEEDRNSEAVREYKRATELDPNYLNAWAHLADIAKGLDDVLAAQASVTLGRLDPNGFHANSREDGVDPAQLWRAVHDALPTAYLMPRDLLPLHHAPPNGDQTFGSGEKEADWPRVRQYGYGYGTNAPWRIPVTASLRVSQLSMVSSIASLLSDDEQNRSELTGFGGG